MPQAPGPSVDGQLDGRAPKVPGTPALKLAASHRQHVKEIPGVKGSSWTD